VFSPDHNVGVTFLRSLFADFFDCQSLARIVMAVWKCSLDFFHKIEELTVRPLTRCHQDLRFIAFFKVA
jgi:hypothetical protein